MYLFILCSGQKLSGEELPVYQYSNDFIKYDKYVQVAIGTVMPKRYIEGRNYQKVDESLKRHKKLKFTGPKWVSKSSCLLAYWYKYMEAKQKVILLGVNTIKLFAQYQTIQHYLETLHKDFSVTRKTKYESSLNRTINNYIESEDPIVLIDLTLTASYEDDVLSLVRCGISASTCLIAMSSGSRSHFHLRKKFLIICYLHICL